MFEQSSDVKEGKSHHLVQRERAVLEALEESNA